MVKSLNYGDQQQFHLLNPRLWHSYHCIQLGNYRIFAITVPSKKSQLLRANEVVQATALSLFSDL